MRPVFAVAIIQCSWLVVNACASEGGSDDPDGSDPACAVCPSGACLPDGSCVECLPDGDQCPLGSYCTADNACAPGCKDDATCASGQCSASHDCERCIADGECAEGRVCANGSCSDRCTTEGASCGGDNTCCSEHCLDTRRSIDHCGACGAACDGSEFCGEDGCLPATPGHVCDSRWVTVVTDGFPADAESGEVLRAGIESGCSPAPTLRSVDQSEVANATTGQPVVGAGEILVLAGGPFGQRIAAYLEAQRIAPLYHGFADDSYQILRAGDDSVVASLAVDDQTPTHQLVLFEAIRDTATGTLVLIVSGFHEVGTAAGAWYFSNVLLGSRASFDKRWYIYEWTDSGAAGPDSADEFVLLHEDG